MNKRELLKLVIRVRSLKVEMDKAKNPKEIAKIKSKMMLLIQEIRANNPTDISSNKYINEIPIT